jgi:hypothetical protein
MKKTTIMPVVCYRTKRGNKYLAYYHHNKEIAQHEVDKLNKYKPQKMWNGVKIDWDDVEEFFVDEQEEMY